MDIVVELQRSCSRAIQYELLYIFRQFPPRFGEHIGSLILFGEFAQEHIIIHNKMAWAAPYSWDCAVFYRERLIGYDLIRIHLHLHAESVAYGACAVGAVEREVSR